MRLYVFRLDDRTSGRSLGIVTIFATPVPDVWRRFVTDDRAERVPHMVHPNEAAALRAELDAIAEGTEIVAGMNLLWQMFSDPHLSHDHRATFTGRHDFPVMGPRIPSDGSLRGHVEHQYQQTQGPGRTE